MAPTPGLKRLGDLPRRERVRLLLIVGACIGGAVLLSLSAPRTKAVGINLLYLVAMLVAAVKFGARAVLEWRAGRRVLAALCALLGLLFALLAVVPLGRLLALLAPAARMTP